MKQITRDQQQNIENWFFKQKVIVLYGPRQAGKTTLAKTILKKYQAENHYYDCEIPQICEILEQKDPSVFHRYFGDAKLIVLDEAQKLEEVGSILKIFHDHCSNIQVIATGSSSFELANKTNEPLTGRGLEFTLLGFSLHELKQFYNPIELDKQIETLLIYGQYPEIALANQTQARILLDDLTNKYLYKDILNRNDVKKPKVIIKLLQLLALQLGQEVSLNELATNLQISADTVDHYLDLLEKAFVVFRLKPFSRNLRKEISKKDKIYFYDVGVRNSLISQCQPLSIRNDIGQLWENFCLIERIKYLEQKQLKVNRYFWRTHDQQEIDYLEEHDGKITCYEFKWREKRSKLPKTFAITYPGSEYKQIHNKNYWDLISN